MSGYDKFCEIQNEYRRKLRGLCNNLLKHELIKRSYDFDRGAPWSRWRLEALRNEFKIRELV